jgi:hypothetical protein
MFSTNIKQKGGEGRRPASRRRIGGILVGGTFGLLALLWSGLIVYVGLTGRVELAPMDVLTCQVAAAKLKAAIVSGSGFSRSSILRPKAGADGAPILTSGLARMFWRAGARRWPTRSPARVPAFPQP